MNQQLSDCWHCLTPDRLCRYYQRTSMGSGKGCCDRCHHTTVGRDEEPVANVTAREGRR